MKTTRNGLGLCLACLLVLPLAAGGCGSPSESGDGLSLTFARAALGDPCPENPQADLDPPALDSLEVFLLRADGSQRYHKSLALVDGVAPTLGSVPTGTDLTLRILGLSGGQVVATGYAEHLDIQSGKSTSASVFMTVPGQVSCAHRPLYSPRAFLAAAPLGNGRILLAGGVDTITAGACPDCRIMTASSAVDVFDPGSGTIYPVARLQKPRALCTATTLADGSVLVVGGVGRLTTPGPALPVGVAPEDLVPSFEVYLPSEDRWIDKPLPEGRVFHTATRLQDGRVLIAGGGPNLTSGLESALLFDPQGESIGDVKTVISHLDTPRLGHTAVALNDGRVLVLGGGLISTKAPADIFDPAQETFQPQTFTGVPFNLFLGDARLIPQRPDEILLAGGSAYDQDTHTLLPPGSANTFIVSVSQAKATQGDPLQAGRLMLSLVELRGDQLLLAGGFSDLALTPADGLEIFDPRTSKFSRPGPAGAEITLSVARGGHAAVGFAGGRSLLVGGLGPEGLLASGEVFTAQETQ